MLEGLYGIVSVASLAVLSSWYSSQYPDLGVRPAVLLIRQALVVSVTTYLAWAAAARSRNSARRAVQHAAQLPSAEAHTAVGKPTAPSEPSSSDAAPGTSIAQPTATEQAAEQAAGGSSEPTTGNASAPPVSTSPHHLPAAISALLGPAPRSTPAPALSHGRASSASPSPSSSSRCTSSPRPSPAVPPRPCYAAPRRLPRYRSPLLHTTTVLKVPAHHPAELVPGFTERLMCALNTHALGTGAGAGAGVGAGVGAGAGGGMGMSMYTGSTLQGIYVREGCIELVLDQVAWHGVGGGDGGGGDAGSGSSSSSGGQGASRGAQAQGQLEGQLAWAAEAGVVPPGALPPGVGPGVVLQQLLLRPPSVEGAAGAAGRRKGQELGCARCCCGSDCGCSGGGGGDVHGIRSVGDVAETVLWGRASWGTR